MRRRLVRRGESGALHGDSAGRRRNEARGCGMALWVYCRGLRLSGGVVTRMRGATSSMLALCSAGIMTWES